MQVKLLKCLVDNIVVDISFDTIGGICTVLFLESIDRLIGQEHLFKRSIILVGLLLKQCSCSGISAHAVRQWIAYTMSGCKMREYAATGQGMVLL